MAFPNRNFSLNQKPKPRIFNESRGNPFRPPRGAAGLSRGHGSRGGRGATPGFLSIPSNSCPDQAPAPGRIRRALLRESRGATRGRSTSPSNPCPNPAPSFQNVRRINRAGIFSLGLRVNRGISTFRRSDPEESRHESFNRGDSSFRRRNPGESEHGPFNRGDSSSRRTSSDKSDHPLSDTVEASLGRRSVPGGFLSKRSPSPTAPPPLPPRQQKPKAITEKEQDEDSLASGLDMSLKEINGKSNESSTEEDLLDNIQKMNLEDPKNEEENTCVICMDKPKTHAYIPCGHRVVCVKCSEELKTKGKLNCVICRKEAHGIFKIF